VTEETYANTDEMSGNSTGVSEYNDEYNKTIMETEEQNEDIEDDDISIKCESQDDIYMTIDDMNTVQEMYTAQLHIDPETGEDTTNAFSELPIRTSQGHNYNLRPRPTRMSAKYDMYSMMQSSNIQKKIAKPYMHIMMMQMNVKEGIKIFGNKGNDTLMTELQQLNIQRALLPLKKEDMSYDQWKKALRYLMFVKEKHDGSIKARGCVDGCSQREYTIKAEISSPTISLEAMMLTCAIDVKE